MKIVKCLKSPTYKVRLRDLELSSLVKRGLRGGIISSVCLNSSWETVKQTLQSCPVKGQEVVNTNINTWNSCELFSCGSYQTGACCPERLLSLHPCDVQTQAGHTAEKPVLVNPSEQGTGLDHLQRFLPSSIILHFNCPV